MAAEHTWAECLPLSGQPAQAECSSQVEWGELFTILQNTVVGSLSLLQGIFPTQGLNSGLLHCRQILYQDLMFLCWGESDLSIAFSTHPESQASS